MDLNTLLCHYYRHHDTLAVVNDSGGLSFFKCYHLNSDRAKELWQLVGVFEMDSIYGYARYPNGTLIAVGDYAVLCNKDSSVQLATKALLRCVYPPELWQGAVAKEEAYVYMAHVCQQQTKQQPTTLKSGKDAVLYKVPVGNWLSLPYASSTDAANITTYELDSCGIFSAVHHPASGLFALGQTEQAKILLNTELDASRPSTIRNYKHWFNFISDTLASANSELAEIVCAALGDYDPKKLSQDETNTVMLRLREVVQAGIRKCDNPDDTRLTHRSWLYFHIHGVSNYEEI